MVNRLNQEIELKLHVPAGQAAAVEAAVNGRNGATRTHLQAAYFDTPDHELAAAGMGWRVRREGRIWVQTLKATIAGGGDGLRREEHNVVVRGRAMPDADASLHLGTPAGERLAEVLNASVDMAGQTFRTDVWRRTRAARVDGGRVELAFDTGTIASGDASLPVCELEIELLAGTPQAVIHTARTWVRRHGLWIDAINKAQRGVMLSQGATEVPVVRAPQPTLTPAMSADAAVREMIRACLVQIMANASAVAGGLGGHEHVHQTRIGIRKLRTVLRVFGDLSPIDPDWSPRLAEVFSRLGTSRDREVVLSNWLTALADVGGPSIHPSTEPPEDPGVPLRDPAFSLLLLDLLHFVHGQADDDGPDLVTEVSDRLQQLRKKSLRHARDFGRLSTEQRHLLRKRLKRLRYTAELTGALFSQKKVQRYLRALEPAQDALGALTDLGVATDLFHDMTEADPQAWFAVGWLSSRHDEVVEACTAPLQAAAKAPSYWR